MVTLKVVTPVKTGVQRLCNCFNILDSGIRRNDEKRTFYKTIKVGRHIICQEKHAISAGYSRAPHQSADVTSV